MHWTTDHKEESIDEFCYSVLQQQQEAIATPPVTPPRVKAPIVMPAKSPRTPAKASTTVMPTKSPKTPAKVSTTVMPAESPKTPAKTSNATPSNVSTLKSATPKTPKAQASARTSLESYQALRAARLLDNKREMASLPGPFLCGQCGEEVGRLQLLHHWNQVWSGSCCNSL